MTATTQKEEEIAQPPSSFFNAKEVMQPPNVQNELALLSPLPFPAVQSVPPSQPALTSASTESIVDRQPQSTTEYIPPLITSGVSTQNPLQQVGTSSLIENPSLPVPVQPKHSRRAILIGLGVAVVVGAGITGGSLWINGRFTRNTTPTSIHLLKPTSSLNNSSTATSRTQTGQLPTPSSFLTATSSQVGITMQYPSDWTEDAPSTTSSGNTFIGFHPQQLPTAISIGRLSATNSAQVTSTSQVNQANLLGFGSANSLGTPQILTNTPTQATIGGAAWDEQDATFTESSGLVLRVTSISVKHNTIYYNILFYAPNTVYAEAVQKYYAQMLNSFQFTSSTHNP